MANAVFSARGATLELVTPDQEGFSVIGCGGEEVTKQTGVDLG